MGSVFLLHSLPRSVATGLHAGQAQGAAGIRMTVVGLSCPQNLLFTLAVRWAQSL